MVKSFQIFKQIRSFIIEIGALTYFGIRFFKSLFKPPFELKELLRQCYIIGYKSLFLVSLTGFIIGLVLTLQTRPTLLQFGAASWMPAMVGVSIIREIGPMITALVCAGKIGSSIGAELGSMRVTEQIDAMEVSGTNPFRYLIVTRILAITLILPLLVIIADFFALYGSFLIEHFKGNVSMQLYFNEVIDALKFGDVFPATIKTFFFGFAIGLVGCFKGFYSKKGTEGVGYAANSAVVLSSILLFILDFIAVFVTDIFFEL